MALRKKDEANLRNEYPVWIELGLVITLGLLIVAFRVSYSGSNDFQVTMEEQDFDASLDLEESLDTSQGPPAPEEEEEEEEQEVFVVVEQQPDCGGVKALQDKVEYPEFAKKAGIEGRVFVQFIVNEQGQVTSPKVTRGVHKLLNQAALDAVKDLKCKPGKQRGEAVKVQMSLPVTFRLR